MVIAVSTCVPKTTACGEIVVRGCSGVSVKILPFVTTPSFPIKLWDGQQCIPRFERPEQPEDKFERSIKDAHIEEQKKGVRTAIGKFQTLQTREALIRGLRPSSLEQAIVVLPEDLKTGDAAFEGWRANLYHDSPSPISYRAPKRPAFARKRILTQGGSTKVGMELAIDIAPPFAFLHETQSSKFSARGCSPSQRKRAGCGKTDGGDGKGEFYVALIVLIRRQGSRSQALEMVVVEGKEVLRRRSDASRPLAHFELRFNPPWQAPPER
ncbi:hypothetical protein BKA70DRAFT_1406861 [Coprinopsis sp. MPI-PUGE-AT-0042]|nr:hypothetical protein BKA70DRAFT_1406861 [Coprinopsis sp. MPI-PUGE-AT-0042]